jgi:hypothetical protein
VHPHAAVLYGGVVERDPGAGQRAVAGRDEALVLVPRLAGLARRLHEQHGLHRLDVRADQRLQHLDDLRVGHRLAHQRRELVRMVDGDDLRHQRLVATPLGRRLADDVAALAAHNGGGLAPQRLDLAAVEQALARHVAIAAVGVRDAA